MMFLKIGQDKEVNDFVSPLSSFPPSSAPHLLLLRRMLAASPT